MWPPKMSSLDGCLWEGVAYEFRPQWVKTFFSLEHCTCQDLTHAPRHMQRFIHVKYADDTRLILDGTRSSIERSFVLLDIFAKLSGLKVNYEKTEALWIGSFKNRTDKLPINQNIKWSIQRVKSLGVWFSSSKAEAVVLNYQEKKEKISKIWKLLAA